MARAGAAMVLAAALAATPGSAETTKNLGCEPRASAGYTASVMRALRAKSDLWGAAALRSPTGPTYGGVRGRLAPLMLARAPGKTTLTRSGVYYLPFAQPLGTSGAGTVNLHVADGGQVIANRVGGAALTVFTGGERFGSCLTRLAPAKLADGWLPVLQTTYRSAAGAAYAQESFAARSGGALASYVHVTPAARFRSRNTVTAEYARWSGGSVRAIDAAEYERARESVAAFWRQRLAAGAQIETPEPVINDALRALLVQNLALTYRYSIGNPYEQFSFPEGIDVAQVMTELGYADVGAAILRTSLSRRPVPYPQWKMGEKLLGNGWHFRLTRDRAHVARVTPTLRRYVARLASAMTPRGLLARERYSSDIPDQVYSLHGQAVVWNGLRTIAEAWEATGRRGDAHKARALAARLGPALHRAVSASQVRMPDGSLFVPVRLLDDERPYQSLTQERLGSYWNLVMPYALASGLFEPNGAHARGIWRYMQRHGSRLLGVVRAGAYALYHDPVFPVGGTDQVYGINVARFLADNDESDELVLSLYGTLAVAMTQNTFVGGEAASVAPLDGRLHRAMYLPPNGATNAAFLETLRSLLVHETATSLELAFGAPRPWLRPGKRIAVTRLPTRFGPVSFTIAAESDAARVTVDVPSRVRPRTLKVRLRFPEGDRTLDLSGRSGRVEVGIPRPGA